MKKKLISFIAIIAMIITMMPVVGISAYADTAVSTWSDLSNAVSMAPTDGTETIIEVGADFNADSIIDIPNGVNIVIQSATGGPYTITREVGYTGTIFGVESGGKLTLKNITLDGNASNVTADFSIVYLWGGEFTMDAGATIKNAKGDISGNSVGICVQTGSIMNMKSGAVIQNVENTEAYGYGSLLIDGILNMDGGTITGNKAVYGGGIVSNASGTINMSGGSVTGNTSDYGGMYVRGTFNISGDPDITGNMKSDNTTNCNLYLYNGHVVNVTGTLTNTTPIGVTTSNTPYTGLPINITTASSQDWSGNFISDNSSYVIQNSGSGSSQGVQLAVSSIINVSDNSGSNLPDGVTYSSSIFTVGAGAYGSTITVIGTTNQNVISVDSGVAVTLVLSGASITAPAASTYSPIDLQGSADVTLALADSTVNTMSGVNTDNCAGIRVASAGGISATLTITGTGTLNAIGGAASTFAGAGIGGGNSESGGTINISGGTVNSTGGGINHGRGGAGIGGGNGGAGGTINISGGIVNASSNFYAAGIGGGIYGVGGNITINGGTVTATGGWGGAGIGGGNGGAGGSINISAGTVSAEGGDNGAGIGGGNNGEGGNITIDAGTVTAAGGDIGAGIGGGNNGEGGNITINGGSVTATGCNGGAGIGGNGKSGGNISINGGTVNAMAGVNGAGIGGGGSVHFLIAGSGGTIIISGGTVTAIGTLGAGIGGGVGNNPVVPTSYVIGTGGSISIDSSAVVKAVSSGDGNPAIQAVSGSGNVINAQLDNAISTSSDTYLKANGNVLKLPATYKDFAFSASKASPITAYSDQSCTTVIDSIITTPGGIANIPLSTTIGATPTLVTIAPSYALTVDLNGGNGATTNGSYASGASVSIDAGTKSGYTFNGWTSSNGGSFGNASNASTTFTMPGNATTITGNWTLDPVSYALTVVLNGGNGATTNSSYASGTTVSIDAGTKSGYTFNGWTSSNGGSFGNASNASTTFTMPGIATTITANWTQNSTGGSGGGGGGGSSYTPPGTNVVVDHNDYHIGTENKGDTNTTVTVDSNKLEDGISKASEGSGVTIPISKNINITAQLVVKNVEDMAKKDMTLTIQTGNVSYNLATSAVDISKITAVLGTTDTKDIPFNVKISNSNAVVNGATVVVSPVEFTITATYKGKTVEVDAFNGYVNRTIEITAEQANKITTAVVVEPNGNLRHVPTKVKIIDGKYYAVINSLTNSTYTVIWHPIEFSDVTNHWAKDAINNMGSRMVVSGDGNNTYAPDRDITRAEFSTILVRALGLEASESVSSFNDVKDSDWYCGYIQTAADYGIITGYDATTFGPTDKITREQAMTMIARAMKITGLKSDLKDSEISALIADYADGISVSDYAINSIATCLKTGVITGRSSDTIAPKYYITRAEVATIVQRLLQKSELI